MTKKRSLVYYTKHRDMRMKCSFTSYSVNLDLQYGQVRFFNNSL
jgi:hypothetical protein